MLDFERLIRETDVYLAELNNELQNKPGDLEAIQALAEAQFEVGNASLALPLIERAIELDRKGEHGASKFFWAGQIYGGRKGLNYFLKGVPLVQKSLRKNTNNAVLREELAMQLSQAYLGMIEIWMTDLCMEPEAEQQCERLITEAFLTCDNDPEAWSVLGSIRISQLRQDHAREALRKSWELFQQAIEQRIVDHNVIPKLLRLAQSMMELRMSEAVLEVTGELYRMDDQVPDLYYLNCIAHQTLAAEANTPVDQSKHLIAAREAGQMLMDLEEPADEELIKATTEILESLPEPEIPDPFDDEDETMPFEIESNEVIGSKIDDLGRLESAGTAYPGAQAISNPGTQGPTGGVAGGQPGGAQQGL